MPFPPYNNLSGAIDHLHNELHVIKQQLRLYADLTKHESIIPITTQANTFSTAMAHLAEQVDRDGVYGGAEELRQVLMGLLSKRRSFFL